MYIEIVIFKEKNRYRCAHFNTKQVFSRCTKEYEHINIYFLNNQMNASVFYTQLTYCTLGFCNYHYVSRVFIYFYLQVWNCGARCFDFSLGFSLSLFCIITTLAFFIILSQSTQLVPNFYLTCSSLWAVIRWLAKIPLGSSTVHVRETPWVKYSTRQVALTVGLRSEPYAFWHACHQFFFTWTLAGS